MNRVCNIQDEAGRVAVSQDEVGEIFVDYFKGLFSAGDVGDMEE